MKKLTDFKFNIQGNSIAEIEGTHINTEAFPDNNPPIEIMLYVGEASGMGLNFSHAIALDYRHTTDPEDKVHTVIERMGVDSIEEIYDILSRTYLLGYLLKNKNTNSL